MHGGPGQESAVQVQPAMPRRSESSITCHKTCLLTEGFNLFTELGHSERHAPFPLQSADQGSRITSVSQIPKQCNRTIVLPTFLAFGMPSFDSFCHSNHAASHKQRAQGTACCEVLGIVNSKMAKVAAKKPAAKKVTARMSTGGKTSSKAKVAATAAPAEVKKATPKTPAKKPTPAKKSAKATPKSKTPKVKKTVATKKVASTKKTPKTPRSAAKKATGVTPKSKGKTPKA